MKKLLDSVDDTTLSYEDMNIKRKNEFVKMEAELTDVRLYSMNMQESHFEIGILSGSQEVSFALTNVDLNFTLNYDL